MRDPLDAGDLPPGLREEYLAGMRTVLGALAAIAERLAIAGNDREALEALQRESHKIHGSAGSYGFMDASRLAAGMEVTVKDWITHSGDREVDRGSTTQWFVARLADMLGLQVP
ncbi:MAG TPA: Hpt domain-containing protein, partial [Gemmatimonadales bacterium]|nr:Hpt domain-containing protein [Gemmatimonadales bacterium]